MRFRVEWGSRSCEAAAPSCADGPYERETGGDETVSVSREEALAYLHGAMERLAREYGVRRIGIFGSVARGEVSEPGDLDVLVDMEEPTFDRYMDLKFELEDRFDVSVDLVMAETLKERLRPAIERETLYA